MNIPDKTTNSTYTGAEFTQFKNEVQNAITALGLTLAGVDNQLAQAFARNASGGASYTDNGSANAYSLQPIGTAQKVTAYRNGDVFRFKATNANTGASILAIDGLSAKQITKNGFTNALTSGDILAGQVYSVYYDSTSDKFVLFTSTKDRTKEILLDEIDATNGGANDLANIDITWNSAWDSYDYFDIVGQGLTKGSAGVIGLALSADSGSTWETFAGLTQEAVSWTNSDIPSNASFMVTGRMHLGNRQKTFMPDSISVDTDLTLINAQDSTQGVGLQYNGSALTSGVSLNFWGSWRTTGTGLNGYMLRLIHDGSGAFTAGTVKIIGYNYP